MISLPSRDSLNGFEINDKNLWLWSYATKARLQTGYKIKELLHYEKSSFQEISIVDTKGFGKILALDGVPQMSTNEGFIYNEMISHIPIVTHANPKKVAMIGGGDCGHVRETMKYVGIEKIDVVEIDQRVTEVCRKWLTPNSYYENDKRVQMIHRNGLDWIKEQKENYDILMIDRPDPEGPGIELFKPSFYQHVFDSLTDDGVVVFQSGSPYYNVSTLQGTVQNLRKLFPVVRTYVFTAPLFPCGIWSFTIASKKYDPLLADLNKLIHEDTRYIDPEIFLASFVLPKYVKSIVEGDNK